MDDADLFVFDRMSGQTAVALLPDFATRATLASNETVFVLTEL
eukprot:SAG31_NODE_1930_length_6881_cov_6.976998_11_plen_43_part_00